MRGITNRSFHLIIAELVAVAVMIRPMDGSALELTFHDALGMAARNNPEVSRAKAELELARSQEPALVALTDVKFVADGARAIDASPQVISDFFGNKTIMDTTSIGFRQRTLIGTEISLLFDTVRQDTRGARFLSFNPAVRSSASLKLSQALLKDFWGRPDKVKRAEARAGVRAAEANVERVRNTAALQGAQTFLDFVAADRETMLRREAVEDATKFLEKMKEKRRYSLVEESNLAQARVNLQLRELESTSALSLRRQARLRLLTAMTANDAIKNDEDVNVSWDFPAPRESTPHPALADAVAARSDVSSLSALEEVASSALKLAKLRKLPELRAIGSYGYAGLDTSYARSFNDLDGWNHPVYSAGLALTIPIKSSSERLAVHVAEQNLSIARANRAGAESMARLDILAARERLDLARKQLAAAGRIVELQREKREMERRSFDRGRSTTEVLIRFAEEERGARRQLLHAKVEFMKSLISLRNSEGNSLTRNSTP